MKYEPINGWTKEKMISQIRKYNTGERARESAGKYGAYMSCKYETTTGNRCAVGCFIPDGHPGLGAGGVADDLLRVYPDLETRMPLPLNALSTMQNVHDTCSEGDVREALKNWIEENVA